MARQRAKTKLLKYLAKRMGKAKRCAMLLGDWKPGKMSFGQKRVGIRMLIDLFQRNGYLVYLISEPYTSKLGKCCVTLTRSRMAVRGGI